MAETLCIKRSPIGKILLAAQEDERIYGVASQSFEFEGRTYTRLEFSANFRQGRCRFGSFQLFTDRPNAGSYYRAVAPGAPVRNQLIEIIRDLVSQWWAVNGGAALKSTLTRQEWELTEGIRKDSERLARHRLELTVAQARLAALNAAP